MTGFLLSRREAALALGAISASPGFATRGNRTDWHALGADVRSEMAWAWAQYREHAWGKDEIKPLTGGNHSFPLKDRHLGLSLIEAMDTLWVMGLEAEFADALGWVKANCSFDVDGEVSVFETSIRLVGGLLSAHHACGDPAVLALARDLTDRLLPAFDTPTEMPYRYVNLKTGAVRDPATNPAECGTYLPEFGTLSKLTGDPKYFDKAWLALKAMFERRSAIGLLADKIDATTGEWLSKRATIGPPSDSFYEYCWDGWQLFGDCDCKQMYDTLTAAILQHQVQHKDGHLWFVDVDSESGALLSTEQDELSSYYGGLLAQGGAGATGAAYTRSWAAVQDRYGILPESYDYATADPTAVTNALRPELADAAFNHWLLDGREEWRELGRTHFLNMKRWNRATYGYADMANVVTKAQADHCPGYWWSEQMKYYYLLFSDTKRFDYKDNYLSTEGNVLKGLLPVTR
jgi:mannosyl-oligosaccharide alpha-1,2-mannosidase